MSRQIAFLVVIGVSDENAQVVKAFRAKREMKYTVVLDGQRLRTPRPRCFASSVGMNSTAAQ